MNDNTLADYTLTMVRMRVEQLMREARRDRLAAAARRAARTRQMARAAADGNGKVIRTR